MSRIKYYIVITVATVVILWIVLRILQYETYLNFIYVILILFVLIIALCEIYFYVNDTYRKYMISRREYLKKKNIKNDGLPSDIIDVTDILLKIKLEYIVISKYSRHDFEIDYVVIGPTGIYFIELKETRGTIDKIFNVLTLDNNYSIDEYIDTLKDKLKNFYVFLKLTEREMKSIKPVLCFTHARVNLLPHELVHDVMVVTIKNIVASITDAPVIFDVTDIQGAYALLCHGSTYDSCRNGAYSQVRHVK